MSDEQIFNRLIAFAKKLENLKSDNPKKPRFMLAQTLDPAPVGFEENKRAVNLLYVRPCEITSIDRGDLEPMGIRFIFKNEALGEGPRVEAITYPEYADRFDLPVRDETSISFLLCPPDEYPDVMRRWAYQVSRREEIASFTP